jgi:hypothetical protein
LGGDISWHDRLAYHLRVAAGWCGALRLLLVLLRQGRWNTRVLRRCLVDLRLAGAPVAGRLPGLICTPLRHYWRLLRAMPSLAHDEAAVWERYLRSLHEELRKASDEPDAGPDKALNDTDARELQFAFLQRFFWGRLRLELPPSADAFARYRRSSHALRDFFDFCDAAGRLSSREEVEKAMGDFATLVQQYRVNHGGQNPPREYFTKLAHVHRRFWNRSAQFFQPGYLLAGIYWGKADPQRVTRGVRLPPWVEKTVTRELKPPAELPRHLLRSVLVFEMALQGLRLLVERCNGLNSFPESPKLIRVLHEAVDDLKRGARAFATGWRWRAW